MLYETPFADIVLFSVAFFAGPDAGLDAGAACYLTKSSFHDQTFLEAVTDLIGEAQS